MRRLRRILSQSFYIGHKIFDFSPSATLCSIEC